MMLQVPGMNTEAYLAVALNLINPPSRRVVLEDAAILPALTILLGGRTIRLVLRLGMNRMGRRTVRRAHAHVGPHGVMTARRALGFRARAPRQRNFTLHGHLKAALRVHHIFSLSLSSLSLSLSLPSPGLLSALSCVFCKCTRACDGHSRCAGSCYSASFQRPPVGVAF